MFPAPRVVPCGRLRGPETEKAFKTCRFAEASTLSQQTESTACRTSSTLSQQPSLLSQQSGHFGLASIVEPYDQLTGPETEKLFEGALSESSTVSQQTESTACRTPFNLSQQSEQFVLASRVENYGGFQLTGPGSAKAFETSVDSLTDFSRLTSGRRPSAPVSLQSFLWEEQINNCAAVTPREERPFGFLLCCLPRSSSVAMTPRHERPFANLLCCLQRTNSAAATPRDAQQLDGPFCHVDTNPETILTGDISDLPARRSSLETIIETACNMMPKVASRAWKLGTRVVIEEVQIERAKHLNGLTGVVSNHPRHGHPTFVKKPSCPDTPQLVLCIVFDNPEVARKRSALLDPRFVKPL